MNILLAPSLLTKEQIERAKWEATKDAEYAFLRLTEKRDAEDKAIAKAQLDAAVAYYVNNSLPPKLNCLRCGHQWTPRQEDVRRCPKCNSPYWDKPKKVRDNG